MAAIKYVTPTYAQQQIKTQKALLVCAYDSEEKFHHNHLEGAMSLSALQARLGRLSRDQELIFYCA